MLKIFPLTVNEFVLFFQSLFISNFVKFEVSLVVIELFIISK